MFGKVVEQAVNKFISLDPETAQRWQSLAGRQVELVILPLEISVFLTLTPSGVQLLKERPEIIDTKIKGTPMVFFQSSMGKIPKGLIIEGNVELGKDLSDVLRQVDIDWEGEAAKVIGDVPAYQIGKITRQAKKFFQQAATSLQENLTEYLQEEARLLPSRLLLTDFYQDVDQLRNDVERLAIRINNLTHTKG